MSQAETQAGCTGGTRRLLRIVVPGDSNNLSHNKRLHWRVQHRLKQQWLEKMMWAARLAGVEPFRGRVRISFVIRRPRLLDPDNARSSSALKAGLDGLVAAGLIKDDSCAFIELGDVRQEKAKACEVEVILEEL